MPETNYQQQTDGQIWQTIRNEAEQEVRSEPLLASFMHAAILKHNSLEQALSFNLATKLDSQTLPAILLRELFDEALSDDQGIRVAMRADLCAVRERDPACHRFLTPLLYFKGYNAVQSYRVGHWLWQHSRRSLALFLQSRVSEALSVDIHPAARIGIGIMVDHATGLVVGETAIVGNNVSMLHEVTLGGTGKQSGQRHPTVGSGVLIGAGAKVLGDVRIGDGAKIGSGSVVLTDIPPHCTATGVPAKVVGKPCVAQPALEMDHQLDNPTT
ncbi:MAG TPA: serine O-acetyltransferase [Gammaproteobacteria bacterium]|nr:serine O-acetyltransferase [Gammaproteobacteria bacterium]